MACEICHGNEESKAKGRLLSFDTGKLAALGKTDVIIAHEFCMNPREGKRERVCTNCEALEHQFCFDTRCTCCHGKGPGKSW